MPISVKHREQELKPDENGTVRGNGFVVREIKGKTVLSNGQGWQVIVESGQNLVIQTPTGQVVVTPEDRG